MILDGFRPSGGREPRFPEDERSQGGEMVLAHNLVFLVCTPRQCTEGLRASLNGSLRAL